MTAPMDSTNAEHFDNTTRQQNQYAGKVIGRQQSSPNTDNDGTRSD